MIFLGNDMQTQAVLVGVGMLHSPFVVNPDLNMVLQLNSSDHLYFSSLVVDAHFRNLEKPQIFLPHNLGNQFHVLSADNRSEDLGNGSDWCEELRRLRVAHLKQELKHYDGSVGYASPLILILTPKN